MRGLDGKLTYHAIKLDLAPVLGGSLAAVGLAEVSLMYSRLPLDLFVFGSGMLGRARAMRSLRRAKRPKQRVNKQQASGDDLICILVGNYNPLDSQT
jgi:hypothetical protein